MHLLEWTAQDLCGGTVHCTWPIYTAYHLSTWLPKILHVNNGIPSFEFNENFKTMRFQINKKSTLPFERQFIFHWRVLLLGTQEQNTNILGVAKNNDFSNEVCTLSVLGLILAPITNMQRDSSHNI